MKSVNHVAAVNDYGDPQPELFTLAIEREGDQVTILALPEGSARPVFGDSGEQGWRITVAQLIELVAGNVTPPELSAAYGLPGKPAGRHIKA
jgi:hypothetical protein